jgi:hypothetical protein
MQYHPLLSLSPQWQTVLSLTCVGVAALYVIWRIVRGMSAKAKSSCGDCRQGPVTGLRQKPLVTLDALSTSAGQVAADRQATESSSPESNSD